MIKHEASSRTEPLDALRALRFLCDASSALAASLDYASTLTAAANLAIPLLADVCCLDLLDEDGSLRRAELACGSSSKRGRATQVKRDVPNPAYERLQARALDLGTTIIITEPERAAADGPALEVGTPHAMLIIPLRARSHCLGLLSLIMSHSARSYSARELSLANDLGSRVALAIDNAQLYKTAQMATQLRDEVLAIVAHDLKSPLSSITLTTSDMLRSAPKPDRRGSRKQLEAIKRGAERMDCLIGDLLDLSSLEAAHLPIRRNEHDLGELLGSAYDTLQPLVRARGLNFVLQRSEGPASVMCDRARILQVMSNLVGNAIEFTPPGGTITIGAQVARNSATLTVTDTGPGVEPRLRSRVFERYWQADAGANKGRGLGLYISKGIVEAHGGAIWVDGEPGRGSTFHFTLPLRLPMAKRAIVPRVPAGRSKGSAFGAEPHASRLVLVVDDDEHMRAALAHVLESEGYKVAQAGNGLEAVEYLNDTKTIPALILIDLQMPVMDGVQLLSELKSTPALASVPVIVVSSHNLKDKIATFDVAAFLEKPVQVDRLLKTLSFEREHNPFGGLM